MNWLSESSELCFCYSCIVKIVCSLFGDKKMLSFNEISFELQTFHVNTSIILLRV
jgi:hypothetical protein